MIPNVATRILGFVAGKFDTVYGVTVPLLKDVKSQAPQAICEVVPTNVPRTLLVNPAAPPFDNQELRRAMALSLDRKAFIDIITEGLGTSAV
jgi:peptide/nickel transport system substrate-binding protein